MSEARLVFNDNKVTKRSTTTDGGDNMGLRDSMEGYFQKFMAELGRKYRDRMDRAVQICPSGRPPAVKSAVTNQKG